MSIMIRIFDKQDLRNISDVLSEIITHSKITEYLRDCNISESEGSNKSDRIYYGKRPFVRRTRFQGRWKALIRDRIC